MPNRVVYDSLVGRVDVCPTCGRRLDRCSCARRGAVTSPPSAARLPGDGIVRVPRDRRYRGGKVVTVVAGLPAGALAQVAAELKRQCGSGGTVKANVVEIQGDHRERVAAALRQWGYTVKLAGG